MRWLATGQVSGSGKRLKLLVRLPLIDQSVTVSSSWFLLFVTSKLAAVHELCSLKKQQSTHLCPCSASLHKQEGNEHPRLSVLAGVAPTESMAKYHPKVYYARANPTLLEVDPMFAWWVCWLGTVRACLPAAAACKPPAGQVGAVI
mgnify:CR=1 FL=1